MNPLNDDGNLISFLSTADLSGVKINNAGIQFRNAAHRFGPVSRREYIFQYMLDGRGYLDIRDRHYCLKKGDLFFIEPDTLSYYRAEPLDPYTYYWVGFEGPSAERLVELAGFSSSCHRRSLCSPEVESCMEMILHHSHGEGAREKLFVFAEFYRLLGLLSAPAESADPHRAYVRQAVELMQSELTTLRIGDLCRRIGLNRSYLSTIFKRTMGISPEEYLINQRLAFACSLFAGDLTIGEICERAGFSNPSNFAVRFRKYTGYSPSEYRAFVRSSNRRAQNEESSVKVPSRGD